MVYSAELFTDFSYTNFTVGLSYRDASDRLRVHFGRLHFLTWTWLKSSHFTSV